MSTEQMGTYEKIYFALWELGQRYGNFVQFRVSEEVMMTE